MTTYKVNEAAVRQARRLIDEGTIDTETGWGETAPAAAEGNKDIEREGYDGYGRWHLGIATEASEETKDRYGFPMGTSRRSTGPPSSTPDSVHRRTTTRRSRRWAATCSTGWTSGRTDPRPRAALPPAWPIRGHTH